VMAATVTSFLSHAVALRRNCNGSMRPTPTRRIGAPITRSPRLHRMEIRRPSGIADRSPVSQHFSVPYRVPPKL
jgi:hypothetical protein